MEERAAFMRNHNRGLGNCAEQMKQAGLEARAAKRRAAVAKVERAKRGIETDAPFMLAHDAASVLKRPHFPATTVNTASADAILFAGMKTCILSPEVIAGPYYLSGEHVRHDLRDGQQGVDLILDMQVIDITTCQPIPDVMVEIWHTNATGVYSGIVAAGNGNQNDTANKDTIYGRGLQPTDADGVAQFLSLFPGHYTGRAIHIHVLVHHGGEVLANGTFSGITASHVGQLFFDQPLISEVEQTWPYSTNTQPFTQNTDDKVYVQELATIDPTNEYALLGDTVSDGILSWVRFAINTTYTFDVIPGALPTPSPTAKPVRV